MSETGDLRDIFEDLHISSDKWEPYFDIYQDYVLQSLYRLINSGRTSFNFVEVGVQKGGSLEMWSQFFKYEADCHRRMHGENFEVKIYGIDVDPECQNLKYVDSNIHVRIGDQGDPAFWDRFLEEVPVIDMFVDDGGHYMHQQILTFEKVFPRLPTGGLYICEDCHTSYMSGNGGGLGRRGTFIEYAKSYVDVLHYNWKEEMTSDLEHKNKIGHGLSGLHFYDSVVVFEKHEKKEMKRVFPKLFTPA